ncbi:hypothetical protein PLICRDRAFT_41126 [Plicaturopsis crispa FD-325 SS-3]|nr:hypothetical protein PLICRDRAFT_41126 [Plicaturopsis crispa FD-325 SS-3]
MTLIHRYAVASEYADMLSTTPDKASSSRKQRRSSWMTSDMSVQTEAWQNALCPSARELQAVLARMRADPDLSQARVFAYLAPLLVFTTLVVLALIVLHVPKAQLATIRILEHPMANVKQLAGAIGAVVLGITGGVVVLRVVIWALSKAVGAFTEMTLKEVEGKRDEDAQEVTLALTSTDVLGGIFS